MELQASMRELQVAEMVEFLHKREGETVNIGNFVFTTVLRTLGMLCLSNSLVSLEDEKPATGLKETIWKFMELSTTPLIADFFPAFDGFDPLFLKRKAENYLNKLFNVWQGIVKERREKSSPDGSKYGNFLDFMLASGFSDNQTDYILLEIIPAGLGGIPTTVEWAMAELLKNKEAMKRVREELETVITSQPIRESQLSQLPYLNACVKETLRLHPPIAFLPHQAQETCQIMSYTIPKNSLVIVNVWALGHDPKFWHNPFAFKPERFLNSSSNGQNFEFLPFGAGRRICPGLPFAVKKVHLILASLISCFQWSLPNDADPT